MAQQKFSYKLTNGKTMELEGAEPPSDDEVEAIAKENGFQLQLADAPSPPPPPKKEEPTNDDQYLHVQRAPGPANPSAERRHQEDYAAKYGDLDPISKRGRDWLATPLTEAPAKFGKQVSQWLDPKQTGIKGGVLDAVQHPRAALSAFIESLGNVGSQLTSPRDIASTVLTMGTTANLLRGKLPGKLGKIADDIVTPPKPSTPRIRPELDPNLQSGMGDPMLAGSTPYPRTKSVSTINPAIDPNLQGGIGDPLLAGSSGPVHQIDPVTNPRYASIDRPEGGWPRSGKLPQIADDIAYGPKEQPYGPQTVDEWVDSIPKTPYVDPYPATTKYAETATEPMLDLKALDEGHSAIRKSYDSLSDAERYEKFETLKKSLESETKPHYKLQDGKLVPAERMALEETTTSLADDVPDNTGVDFESSVVPENSGLQKSELNNDIQLIQQKGKLTLEDLGNDSTKIKDYAKYLRGEDTISQPVTSDQIPDLELHNRILQEEKAIKSDYDTSTGDETLANLDKQFGSMPPESIRTVGSGSTSLPQPHLSSIADDIAGAEQQLPESWQKLTERPKSTQQILNEAAIMKRRELMAQRQATAQDAQIVPKTEPPVTGTPPTTPDVPLTPEQQAGMAGFKPPPPRPLPTEPLPPPNVPNAAAPRQRSVNPLTPPDTPRPTLDKTLAGAKPRYNIGQNAYEPVFESDLDKALFIIAQKTPSKRNADYLAFAMKHTGLDEKAVLKLADSTKQAIKQQLQGNQSGQVKIPSINNAIPAVPPPPISAPPGGPPSVPPTGPPRVPPNVPPTPPPTGPPTPPPNQIPNAILTNNKKAQIAMMTRPHEKESALRKVLDFNRTLLTAYDMSAPLRQGLGMITHKEFWTSLDDMFKSVGSKRGFETVMKSIEDDPSGYFKRGVSGAGTQLPSYAEKVGLAVHDIPEEIFRGAGGRLAERILPGVAHSNRAYTGYLAKLRADGFKRLVNEAEKAGKDPLNDTVLGKKIADFINTATGRGSLGKLEPVVKQLSDVFFAPKLMASRLQTYNNALNPWKLANADPMLRREAIRSLFGVVMTGGTISGLAKTAGADVSLDPRSTDFMKIHIGNSRYDPFGGYQQYAVNTAKFITGTSVSSKDPNKSLDLTAGRYGQDTRQDIASRFFTNKLAPVPSLIWSWMGNKEFDGTPFEAKKAILTRTVPIFLQDMTELLKEDPNMVPAHIKALFTSGSFFGGGIQTYGR